MFGFFFGWRKASKCKKLIKQLQCRLKLLKNKRSSIVKLLRGDVVELIKIGYEETAFNRAEHLFEDENAMAVYELLDNFCEFIGMNLSYIRKRKDIPNDINEAVSSLIYASSRCGDLPELRVIRKLFEERYGQRFAVAAAELLPGNLVNCQIIKKLSVNSVPDDVKHQWVDEIAGDYCLRPELLALEYTSELQQMQESSIHLAQDIYTCYSRAGGCQRETSNADKIEAIYVDSLLTSTKSTGLNQSDSQSHQNSAFSTSFSSSIVQQSSPYGSDSPMIDKADKVENVAQFDSLYGITAAGVHCKERQIGGTINTATPINWEDRTTAASSSESLPLFPEEKVVYLDDIQEFQTSMRRDGDFLDQRLFKFKPSVLPKTETIDGCNVSFMDEYESWSEKTSSRSSRKCVKASGKQPRRRSLSQEISGIKDIECEIYYEKPRKSSANKHRSHYHRNKQKKSTVETSKQPKLSCCLESGSNFQSCNCKYNRKISCCPSHFNGKMNDCSLEHSCHCFIDDDEKVKKVPPSKQQIGIRKSVGSPAHHLKCESICYHFDRLYSFQNGESVKDIEAPTLPQNARRKSYDHATKYSIFTYPDHWPNEHIERTTGNVKAFESPRTWAAEGVSLTGKKPKPPYLTVKTMPPERAKESWRDNTLRCMSFPCEYPDHVHPKLPNYDDITAKFMALKKEHLQNKR